MGPDEEEDTGNDDSDGDGKPDQEVELSPGVPSLARERLDCAYLLQGVAWS